MNIFLLIITLFLIKNRSIIGKVFYENSFLLGTDGWILTGNKLENTILHQPYSLQQQGSRDNNGNYMSHYIIAKDDLINVDSKNKDDKNLWYFKSPSIKLTLGKPDNKKPILLTFTLTSFMGDFRNLNRCSALIKIIYKKGDTIFYPHIKKYDGNIVSFNVLLRNDLWYNEDVNKDVNFDTIFEDAFKIEILGDWTRGVEVIGLDNVIIY
jgi:hypothetical protein